MHILMKKICFFVFLLSTCVLAVPGVEVYLRARNNEIPYSPVVGDIDGDGHPEIVIASKDDGTTNGWVTVVRKNPSPPSSVDTLWSRRYGRACFTPAIADVDGDGIAEIFCVAYFDSPGGMGVISIDGLSGSINWALNIGGAYYRSSGHELLLADYDNDGEIDVIAQMNRTTPAIYEIVVIGAVSGVEKFRINTGSKRSYGSMYCGDLTGSGYKQLVASVTAGVSGDVEVVVWNSAGSQLWRANGGPPAIADVDLDGQPEIVCGWINSSYRYHLYVYSHTGELERELATINSTSTLYSHYECPVIADFDPATPGPEIAFAVNHTPTSSQCRVSVIRLNGTYFWQHPPFSEGEIISMSAADLSCDGIWDLCGYNMAGEFVVFDGSSGAIWARFGDFEGDYEPDPNRFVAIADMDYDCRAEFAVSTYGGSYSTNRGVYIYGNDAEWNPVRRLWNTGSYYYTNIDDRLRMDSPDVSYRHWEVENIWRAQRVIRCGLEITPHINPIACVRCDSIGNFVFDVRVWNPTCAQTAYSTRCILEFNPAGRSCFTNLAGQCTTFIGDMPPETDTVLSFTLAIAPNCDSLDLSFWIHATCLNSLVVENRHLRVPVMTPRCHYPPGVVRVRPIHCGQVVSCGPNDSLGTVIHTGQEIIFNVAADTFFGMSYPLDFSSIFLDVGSRFYPLVSIPFSDPRITWSGDNYQGALFYNPNPLYPHGDTVVFRISSVRNELGCFTESARCSMIIDDRAPDTLDVHPDHMSFVNYAMLGNIYAVLHDDFLNIVPASFQTGNVSITANGIPISFIVDPRFDGIDPDTLFFRNVSANPGDTVEVCIWGLYDSADDTNFCGPNRMRRTCWEFIVLAREPFATLIHPRPNTYSACPDQKIIIRIDSEAPLDTMTFELEIDSVVHTIREEWLRWDASQNYLYWEPDTGWWRSGNQANVCLIRAENIVRQNLSNAPLCFDFWLDFDPPNMSFLSPPMGVNTMLTDLSPTVMVRISEPLSGLNTNSIDFVIDGMSIRMPPLMLDSLGNGNWALTFIPRSAGITLNPGDTIRVSVRSCDKPDYCNPNCATVVDSFIIEPFISCLIFPNPFTPDGDMVNDFTSFNYPHMFTQSAELFIFDVHNKLMFSKTIGPVRDFSEYRVRSWDGNDSQGKPVAEGLYLYVIKQEGKVVCNGTVILAR